MEEKPIESPRKDEMADIEEKRESPEISEKEGVIVDEIEGNRHEIVTT